MMMHKPITMLAINARYSHSSLGARSLLCAMDDELRAQARLVEANINQSSAEIVQAVLSTRPILVGIGVYIWNRTVVEELLPLLREAQPPCTIILGGPEISYTRESRLAQAADCVVQGEGEWLWPQLCRQVLRGKAIPRWPDPHKPDLANLPLAVALYSDKDIATRNLYVETARGCPFACRFCLSSLDPSVRAFPFPAIKDALQHLLDRGARKIRFVDRSFNLGGQLALQVLDFLLESPLQPARIHLEMVPDRLTPAMRDRLRRFQPGQLHIETGIQSFNSSVLARMHRSANRVAVEAGIDWLITVAQADVHADLIGGLPGESLASFRSGFNRLYRLDPAEIQIGVLKHLPGTDLDQEPGMHFSHLPPYEVLRSDAMTAEDVAMIRRMAAHWERVANRGHFPSALPVLLGHDTPWQQFDAFSQTLAHQHGLYGFGLLEVAALLLPALTQQAGLSPREARRLLRADYLSGKRRMHVPAFLRD